MECVGREWYVSGPGTVGDKGTAVPIKANKEINRTVRELGNCSTPTHTFLTSESGQAVGVKKKKKKNNKFRFTVRGRENICHSFTGGEAGREKAIHWPSGTASSAFSAGSAIAEACRQQVDRRHILPCIAMLCYVTVYHAISFEGSID